MLLNLIDKLIAHKNLTTTESSKAIKIMLNTTNHYQTAAFLTLLHAKQETAAEILGIARAMRSVMLPLKTKTAVLDIVGTGGDRANTINISTGASILAASCGVKIAKHGNRSISSACGSADVLAALGVNINCQPKTILTCINKVGFGFCFAQTFHPALKILKEVRKNLGIPTCFNLLGPLLNPANAEYLMLGVFKENLVELMAEVLMQLTIKRALVFHSHGLDELSCIGPAKVIEINNHKKHSYILDPKSLGFASCQLTDLKGGSPPKNAEILLNVLTGKPGPVADTLILNAAVALYLYGIAPTIKAGIPLIKKNIKNGNAIKTLYNLITYSNETKPYAPYQHFN